MTVGGGGLVSKASSYSATRIGVLSRVREIVRLVWKHMACPTAGIRVTIERMEKAERLIETELGLRMENMKILEIGPGQLFRQMRYFGMKNEVVGIDLDVLPQGFCLRDYVRLMRRNGLVRVVKTVGRKVLGVDRRFRREYSRQLG